MATVQGVEVSAECFKGRVPKYARLFFPGKQPGDILMSPRLMGGDPASICLCAMLDGAERVSVGSRMYVSARWALSDLKEIDHEAVRKILEAVRVHVKGEV